MTRDIKSSAVKAMLRVTMMATIVLALLVGLAGQAWAQEAQRIVPHVTCGDLDPYTRTNPDGTKSGQWYGAWIGYTSTYEANKTLTAGSQYNYFNPGQLNRRQPSNFSPGRHDYVFYVVVERVVSPNLFWMPSTAVSPQSPPALQQTPKQRRFPVAPPRARAPRRPRP